MAKKKKKPAPKQKKQAKNKFQLKRLIAIITAAALVVTGVVVIVITANKSGEAQALRGTRWVSETAKNASGDEVDVREVYDVKYTNYQGRLTFEGADGFQLWLRPGDQGDGTHSGTYKLSGDRAEVTYDDGTESEFRIIRTGGEITQIIVPFENYEVGFYRETAQ